MLQKVCDRLYDENANFHAAFSGLDPLPIEDAKVCSFGVLLYALVLYCVLTP